MSKQFSKKPNLAFAKVKGLPVPPIKARAVADLIRLQGCQQARGILQSLPQKIAPLLRKLLDSAIANAEQKVGDLSDVNLYISELRVDEGPSRVRIWRRSKGRADRLLRRSSHVYMAVDRRA